MASVLSIRKPTRKTTSTQLTISFERTRSPPNPLPKCPSNPLIFQTAFTTLASTRAVSTASTNCTSTSQKLFSFICMYVCTETRAEGQTTFVKYQSVLDFGTVWVLRKNHVFEEHAACFWGVLELRLGIAAVVRTWKWYSFAGVLQVGQLGRWVAGVTVGQMNYDWDSWACGFLVM